MRKYVCVPDSFKGTMSSADVCRIMAERIRLREPDADVVCIPVADGGEGSVDCFLEAVGGERRAVRVSGPFPGEQVDGFYGLIHGDTAVIEMAACAGLPLAEGRLDPRATTTFGVGELMLAAARAGAKRLIVGLGGSATNDGGCGAAAACGVRFWDESGTEFVPTGGTLARIARIDAAGLDPALRNVQITAMCDIDNPMHGPAGAAFVFGPQKGADEACVRELDQGLVHLAGALLRDEGAGVAQVPGAGAAGAMGAGMVAFFGATLRMGIEVVLDAVRFDELIRDAALVLTGEGKIDSQSLRGKVAIGVARRAKAQDVPVVAVVGDIGDEIEAAYDEGISGVLSINRVAVEFSKARLRSPADLALTIDTLMRLLALPPLRAKQ